MNTFCRLAGGLIAVTGVELAIAVPVELTDFSASAIIVNFDSLPNGDSIAGIAVPPYSGSINPASVIDDEYASLGVEFSSVDSGAVAVTDATGQVGGISSPNSLVGTLDSTRFTTGGPIFASFVDPLTGLPATTTSVGAFSIDVDISPVALTAFDLNGAVLETVFFAVGANGSVDFAGISRTEGIASVSINDPGTDFLAIDNFIFEPVTRAQIPVSPVLALVGIGLAGFGYQRIQLKAT
jgi:hypothetical protein